MNPQVVAAIIAASISFLTLIGTLAASTSAAAQPVSSWTGRSRSNAPGP